MTEAIEPGPAIIGIAIGKTLMSSASGVPSISLARSSRRSVRRSNTMSSAIMNSMIPPARRKALREMPSVRSNGSPSKREEQQDAPGDDRRADRHRAAMGRDGAAGQAGEDRRAAGRVDDDEEA